jgi:hypothetical protein
MRFFNPENGRNDVDNYYVDIVVNFSWLRSTPQSEFPIKNYGRLKLR